MDQFLERHKLPKPTQGKIDSWVDISIIDRSTRFRWFHGWTLPNIEGRNDTALYNLFQKIQRKHFLTHSMRPALP